MKSPNPELRYISKGSLVREAELLRYRKRRRKMWREHIKTQKEEFRGLVSGN